MADNTEFVKIHIRRGTESQLPILDQGEPAYTVDTGKLFIGDGTTNHQFAKQTDVDANTSSLADISTVNNHTITYGYDANGNVQTITEKDVSNNIIKTVTYSYDTSGNVTQSVTVMNGQTVTTTYNYDVNGNVTNTSNVIS